MHQIVNKTMNSIQIQVGIKAGVLYYMEGAKVESQTIVYLLQNEAAFLEEVEQSGTDIKTKQFVMELKDKYGINKE